MTIKVTLESGGEVLSLDEISMEGKGVEAIAGLTGFGLPPVDVQWFEGAGDGARARNVRVLPRDLDVPLYVFTDTRAELKVILQKIARVMSRPMILKVWDGAEYVWAEVVRAGGGTYVMGTDTDAETVWQTIVTLRAGDPYWQYSEAVTVEGVTTGIPTYDETFVGFNPGSAKAYPSYEIVGPADRISITTGDEYLDWTGYLGIGDTLTIDTAKATVVDQTGANRYSGLGAAPRMASIDPGDWSTQITCENSSVGLTRTNYSRYGSFKGASHGFTLTNCTADMTPGSVKFTGVGTSRGSAVTTITGLPVGESLVLRTTVSLNRAANAIATHVDINGSRYNVTGLSTSRPDATLVGIDITLAPVEIVHEFVVPDDGTLTLKVINGTWSTSKRSGAVATTLSGGLYVGSPGAYFDGDDTDTASTVYAWTGTPYASTSTETQLAAVSASARITYTPRDWMVV